MKREFCSAGIWMKKKQIIYGALASWLIFIFTLMILIGNVDIEVFFVLGFIGLLITMNLMEKKFSQPDYMKYFWYLTVIGIGIISVIAIQKTMKYL